MTIEEKQKGPHWNNIRQGREIQGDLAKGLMSMAGLDDHLGVCGLQEIKAIQQAIQPRYQIKVYSKDTFNYLVYQGDVVSDNVLHLYCIIMIAILTALPNYQPFLVGVA